MSFCSVAFTWKLTVIIIAQLFLQRPQQFRKNRKNIQQNIPTQHQVGGGVFQCDYVSLNLSDKATTFFSRHGIRHSFGAMKTETAG